MATMDTRMGSMPQPYPNLPASPTLTNPDMILPDYDRSTSPDSDEDGHNVLSQSTMMWKNRDAMTSNSDLQQLFSGVHGFPAGPVTPTTPIIYGNGTMLSDIGEVTEAESTPAKPSPSSVRRRHADSTSTLSDGLRTPSRSKSPSPLPHHYRTQHHQHALDEEADPDTPRRTSPTAVAADGSNGSPGAKTVHLPGVGGIKARARQQQQHQVQKKKSQERTRRDSIDSSSTITTEEQAGLFADFDDAISVGDSVFQGDDEESVAESYSEDPFVTRPPPKALSLAVVPPASGGLAATPSLLAVPLQATTGFSSDNPSDDDRRHSTASISRRAEEILANAKQRLTTMEDNLTRARTSLYITSPTRGSFRSDDSTPSPRTPVRASTALGPSRPFENSPPTSLHKRMSSEDSTTPPASAVGGRQPIPQRSASALGAAGGYRPPRLVSTQRSVEQIRDSLSGGYAHAGYGRSSEGVLSPLLPLSEDQPLDTRVIPPYQGPSAGSHYDSNSSAFLSPARSTFSGSGSDRGLTRSASVAQMRNIKDHVKDLKGKISSLREQARADSMKRRSLQSLRTLSPFTHAQVDQWYADPHTGEAADDNQEPQQEQPLEQHAEQNVQEDAEEGIAIPWNGAAEPALSHTSSSRGSRPLPSEGGSGELARVPVTTEHNTVASTISRELDRAASRSSHSNSAGSKQGLSADDESTASAQNMEGTVDSRHHSLSPSLHQTKEIFNGATAEIVPDETAALANGSVQNSMSNGTSDSIKGGGTFGNNDSADDMDDMQTENGSGDEDEGYSEGKFGDVVDMGDDDSLMTADEESGVAFEAREMQGRSLHDVDEARERGLDGMRGTDDGDEQFTNDGYESESGDSLYHDTLQHQISHEDREDAFDYEHFILHSALGTISQQRLDRHNRSGSFSSEGSVETTRGPYAERNMMATASAAEATRLHLTEASRRSSTSSLSTVASFATATEGRQSRTMRTSSEEEEVVSNYYQKMQQRNSQGSVVESRLRKTGSFIGAAGGSSGWHSMMGGKRASARMAGQRSSMEEPRVLVQQQQQQQQMLAMPQRPSSSAAVAGHRPSVSSFESTGTTRSFPLVNRNRALGSSRSSSSSIAGASQATVNGHAKNANGVAPNTTASGRPSPDVAERDHEELKSISESLLSETASICEQRSEMGSLSDGSQPPPSQMQMQMQTQKQNGLARGSLDSQRDGDDTDVTSGTSGTSSGTGVKSAKPAATQPQKTAPGQAQALKMLEHDDQQLVERLVGSLGQCVLGLTENGRTSPETALFRRRIEAAQRILEGIDSA